MNQLNASPNNYKSKVVTVTPEYAEQLLLRNTNNRRVRPTRVKEFIDIIKKNEWQVTHQGIALDSAGVLVDGQHRLQAVVASGKPVDMFVTEGLAETARLAVDTHSKRSFADIFNVDKDVLAPIVELARLRFSKAPRPEQVQLMSDRFLGESEQLLNAVKAHARRLIGSAPVKAAAILRISTGESRDYVYDLYNNMAQVKTEALPPVARSFLRQIVEGTIGKRAGWIVKAHIVFARENAEIQKVQVKKMDMRVAELREQLVELTQ